MIKINILTLFPDLYKAMTEGTVLKKAIDKNKVELNVIDIRDYSLNKHKKVDDYIYGGCEGMLLQIEPIDRAIELNKLENSRLIYTSPKGKTINQDYLYELAQDSEITILVGRYEGVDQRVFEKYKFEEVSGGDYILSGGDIIAQIIIDGVTRVIPEVLNNGNSYKNDTFTQDLLEHPQYTRPENYKGYIVPEVLLSGHHKNIEKWKLEKQIDETKNKRPDIYKKYLGENNDT